MAVLQLATNGGQMSDQPSSALHQTPTRGAQLMAVPDAPVSALSRLEAELAARDKTIEVLIARVEGQFAQSGSSFAVLEQNISLEQQVKRRTRELQSSHEDLTRTLAELRHAQAQLLESNKLEAIGQLAAGVAHEINTPIQYVSDNAGFLETAFQQLVELLGETSTVVNALTASSDAPNALHELAEKFRATRLDWLREEIPRAIAESMDGLERVSTIVSAMKEFSHPSAAEKEMTDLHDAITTTITVARHEWKYVADIETHFDPAVPSIPCLRNQLNQVVLNLIVNASHAIAERLGDGASKGKITITTELSNAEVELRVQDDGVGIPPGVASRIYDPFFTTKPVGKGTGQGLSIARSVVVERHGGSIRFESTPGVGTCFFIRLPITAATGASEAPRRVSVSLMTGGAASGRDT
jgi:two-component system, NtrC family, sensor kinase